MSIFQNINVRCPARLVSYVGRDRALVPLITHSLSVKETGHGALTFRKKGAVPRATGSGWSTRLKGQRKRADTAKGQEAAGNNRNQRANANCNAFERERERPGVIPLIMKIN